MEEVAVSFRSLLFPLLLTIGALMGACSDDNSARMDSGPGLPDMGVSQRDGPVLSTICQANCQAQKPYLCLPNSAANNICVECLTDEQCVKNPGSLGAKCAAASNACSCTEDSQCKGKIHGARCDSTYSMCSCADDTDCVAPWRCISTLFGASVCGKPCLQDTDCTSSTYSKCDTSTGRCGQCLKDSDCVSSTNKYCLVSAGKCVACKTDAHCADGVAPYCDSASGICSQCGEDSHCSGYVWGNKCQSSGASGKLCLCDKDADCAGNANGASCLVKTRRCSCTADSQCTVKPYTRCMEAYSGAAYKNCQKPCLVDTDCPSSNAPRCQTSTGKCVPCLADKDCPGSTTPLCDTAKNNCVACKTGADCLLSQTGTRCSSGHCTCLSDGDCKGAYAWGAKCDAALSRCSCADNTHCASSGNGPTCFSQWNKCSCTKDTECKQAPYTLCSPAYSTAANNYCQKPCTKDAECDSTNKCLAGGKCGACTKDADCPGSNKYCHASLARCVACKTTADCAGPLVCVAATGRCVSCVKDAECATSLRGGKCISGTCACGSDQDCKSGHAWGDTCDTSAGQCSCKANTGCVSNVNGPTCFTQYKKCSCIKDGDCANKAYNKCELPYGGATYKHCQKLCQVDKDCVAASAPYCQASLGKCRGCLKDDQCKGQLWAKKCDTTSFGCVECRASSDCGADALGNTCSSGICVCATDQDCAQSNIGNKCDPSQKACSCTAAAPCPTGKTCTGSTSFGTKYCR